MLIMMNRDKSVMDQKESEKKITSVDTIMAKFNEISLE